MIRLGLAALLVGLLAAAVATAGGSAAPRSQAAPAAHKNTEIILDLSGSIVANTYPPIARTLRTIYRDAGATGTVGLVLFSDTAVEALPPGTPARELLPFLRFFELPRKGPMPTYPENPWAQSLTGGTAISTGIEAARQALARDRVGGRVVLISDLGDNLIDKHQLKGELIQLFRLPSVEMQVVALPGTDWQDARVYRSLLGGRSIIHTFPQTAPTKTAGEAAVAIPGGLLLLTILAAVALGANELFGVSLRWREGRR